MLRRVVGDAAIDGPRGRRIPRGSGPAESRRYAGAVRRARKFGRNLFDLARLVCRASSKPPNRGDYRAGFPRQQKLTEFLLLIATGYPLFPACTAILNARGIPGKVHPSPIKVLKPEEKERLLKEPLVRELLG